jgi:hypothetical protein
MDIYLNGIIVMDGKHGRIGEIKMRNIRRRLRDGAGRNDGDKPGAGPDGNCICPNCGTKVRHIIGVLCNRTKCPKCGALMTRE